jgi:hypothetical protein
MLSQNNKENSRFIAFFDECGDHSLIKIDPDFPMFILCAVIVERSIYGSVILKEIGSFKMRYFDHEGINLHSRDIRKASGEFSILLNPKTRERFLTELSDLISRIPFTIFITCINKHSYKKKYGNYAKNPYEVALEYTFERVMNFMEHHQEINLPVIAEARGKKEDDELRNSFRILMRDGNKNYSAARKNLNCSISFRKKNDNICGIQIADLCAHPVARHIIKPKIQNRAYNAIKQHFYTNDKINGPYIFP